MNSLPTSSSTDSRPQADAKYVCRWQNYYTPTTRSELARESYLHLSATGIDQVVGEIVTAAPVGGGSAPRRVTKDEIASHVFDRTLEGVGANFLPSRSESSRSEGSERKLESNAWLQVQSVKDLTISMAQQANGNTSTGSRRMLQILLSDGHSSISSIEFGSLPFTSRQLIPGSKLLVLGSATIRDGILLLTPDVIGPLQGRVASLADAHALKLSSLDRVVPLAPGESGPPIFRPFSERHIAAAELERQREIQRARAAQEAAALAPKPIAKLMPPPPIEEAVRKQQTTKAQSLRQEIAQRQANEAKARQQVELEEEYEAQEQAKIVKAIASSPSARPSSAAPSTPSSTLSSFRVLLQAPLHSIQSFSAQPTDVQLYPPRAPSTDFILQLTFTDTFGMRTQAIANTTIFETLFGSQSTFQSSMTSKEGQAAIQKRLTLVRTKLCATGFQTIQLEIQPGQTPQSGRSFRLIAMAALRTQQTQTNSSTAENTSLSK